jgi:5'-nucleotidase / UDP-sugar diphosphatase
MNRLLPVFTLALAFFFSACSHSLKDTDILKVTILHTNDVHGHLWPEKRKDGLVRGGIAAFAYQVKKIREEVEKKDGVILVLSAGDANTGVPDSDHFFAEPDFRAMDLIGFDALALGNHEFDNGIEKIHQQKSWVRFPLLSANVVPLGSQKLVDAYTIVEKKGLKIGILGLTTDSLRSLVLKEHTTSLDVRSPIETARTQVPEMKKAGAQLIIALTHLGISHNDKKRIVLTHDDLELARANLGIPVIVGGHSHTLLPNGLREGETLLVQAGEFGEFFGRVDLEWSRKEGKILRSAASVIRLNPEEGQDKEVLAALKPFEEKAKEIFDGVVGRTEVNLDGETDQVRTRETNLGNFVCDVLRSRSGADIAVFNGGGIRGSIPAGPVTLRDVLRIFPFKNTIVTATFSGRQLRQLIASAVENRRKFGGSFLQVSGMGYSIKGDKLVDLVVGDKKVNDSQKFTLATNNFVMSGGDRLEIRVQAKDVKNTGISVSDALVEHLKKFRSISPQQEGKIKILD